MDITSITCRCCGACCRWPGYVRLRAEEVAAVAAFLGLEPGSFTERYTRLTADRRGLALVDQADKSCVFLSSDNRCRIHDVKPQQCRDFPLLWSFPGVEAVCPACADAAAGVALTAINDN